MLLRHKHYSGNALIGFMLLICGLVGNTIAAIDKQIDEHEGKTVVLPCPVNKDKCGELHSINWFKGDDRIAAMLLDDSNVTSVSPEYQDRVTALQNPFRLIIKDLQIADEDIYLCDTTFFIPVETCDNFNGYRVELNVLENIVPPTEVVILDEKGDRLENGTIVGPMEERQILKSTCVVRNTRPQPVVGWWRGNKRLTTHSPSYDEKDGLFTATLELTLQLSREDLGQDIECRVESAAVPNTIKNQFSVDMQVRPTSITINGVEHHTVQGSKVVLTCDIHGARPPVNLTWYNSTGTISPEENDLTEIRTKAFEKDDGTYHTQSELIFNATRFENDRIFRCDAENVVLQINREKPFTASLTLEVLYPPVVKVSPPEITVNTSDTVLLNCEYVANPASLTKVVWYRNSEVVNVNDTDRYEGGNSENVALVIRSTDKEDIGNYTCQLSNAIGKGVSEQQIDLDVQYVPIVEVLMIPEGPVKESDESNVTLYCNILEANPATLTKVRWYANSTLLKELPDCEETREDLCHIDPSKLLLESIGRGFFYNYSCEGYNAAGWGPRSEDKELMVHYEPGPAKLMHFPLIAVKKKSVTFSCSVEDPGYPESNRFRWLRGGRGPLQDIVTKDWTVEPVGLDSRTNYSCYAYNDGGQGVMATVNLEVHAPPFFIKNLPPYTGMLHSSPHANLTCRIECVPRCEISWLKDGVAIDKNDTRYFVKEKYMDASPATGDFESMLSVLHFNMSNWPNKKFDIEADNANYTCVSTGNTVGAGIKSATYFSIEYAPDNTTVSEEVVYVQEDTIPGRVICKSRANPEPSYEWRFNNKTVIRGNALIINTPMVRNDTGRYTCLAFNKHGRSTAETSIDVQFKPRCEIERREIDDQDTLICTAFGNPEEADFSWSIKAENETVEWLGSGDSKTDKDKSFYVLEQDYAIARTYRCVANNTAGAGPFCEIEVAVRPKKQLAWWQRWDKTTLIILVISVFALLIAVIIICCIIICICRRRRRQDKLNEKSSSLGDPLTEPGEYENLPFHGLQTAPNKFSTTSTNFNNNTNVVRVAPRPKRLNGNISQVTHVQHQQEYYDQEQQLQYQHQQQQHQHQQQQQQQYNTMQYGRNQQLTQTMNSQHIMGNGNNANNKAIHHLQDGATTVPHTNPHQITYNLNNCFPKSYTEYYHQQQQQKFNSNSASNAQLLNAIEHDYPAYAVVERNTVANNSLAANTNPFLAITNFKKYDTDISGGGGTYATGTDGAIISATGSMHRNKRKHLLDKCTEDKKFYSLKFTGGKNKHSANKPPTALGLNASMITGSTSAATAMGNAKCKRHHSFAGGGIGDVDSQGSSVQQQQQQAMGHNSLLPPLAKSAMRFYDPPVYENLSDSVQIHECEIEPHPQPGSSSTTNAQHKQQKSGTTGTATVLLHPQPNSHAAGHTSQKKKRRHRQHQQKDDFNLIEPERLSIYRSDSGISNSSYEAVTPLTGGNTARNNNANGTPPPKTPKSVKSNKNGLPNALPMGSQKKTTRLASSAVTPLYMNVDGQSQTQLERASSPVSTLVNSSYESASSSQNDGTGACSTDPTSISSCNSLYSSGTGTIIGGGIAISKTTAAAARCNRHQKPADITTPEEFEQYQLGHHAHSSSSLSVASNASANGRKCKKRANVLSVGVSGTGLNESTIANTNPFLATKYTASTHTAAHGNCNLAKLRRKTISDPYAHIKYITDSSANNSETYNYCTKSTYIAQTAATATATTKSAATTCKSQQQQQQQISLQQCNINNANNLIYQQHNKQPYYQQRNQQQMLMPNKAADDDNDNDKDNNDDGDGNGDGDGDNEVPLQQCGLGQANEKLKLPTRQRISNVINMQTYAATKLNEQHEQQQTTHLLTTAAIDATIDAASDDVAAVDTNAAVAAGYVGRPIRLPLRKYHSFHFQPSQTVAGIRLCKLQQLRMEMQYQQQLHELQLQLQQQQKQHQLEQQLLRMYAPPVKPPKHFADLGPLVFQPFTLNENRAFKPISPVTGNAAATCTDTTTVVSTEAAAIVVTDEVQANKFNASVDTNYTDGDCVVDDVDEYSNKFGKTKVETVQEEMEETEVDEEEKSEMSEEFSDEIKQITNVADNASNLYAYTANRHNPAASLEALEALTKCDPEFINASRPGNRQNLHTQIPFAARDESTTPQLLAKLRTQLEGSQNMTNTCQASTAATIPATVAEDDDDEDLGYSYCEEIATDDDDETLTGDSSPNPTVILSADRSGGGQVKFIMQHSSREVHI